jgi:hypothetical protein
MARLGSLSASLPPRVQAGESARPLPLDAQRRRPFREEWDRQGNDCVILFGSNFV